MSLRIEDAKRFSGRAMGCTTVLALLASVSGCALDWSKPHDPVEPLDAGDATTPSRAAGESCTEHAECDDGRFCNGQEKCLDGTCTAGDPPQLDDPWECTKDSCDEQEKTVKHEPDHTACDDKVACNGRETCDPAGGCVRASDPESDDDRDGFREADGDCDDCEALVNPKAMEIPNNGVDDDCDKTVDVSAAGTCDAELTLATIEPDDAAAAMELCSRASVHGWGLISASYVAPDGRALPANADYHRGHGLLPSFGAEMAPRAGTKLLALSTGAARAADQDGFKDPSRGLDKGYSTEPVAELPLESAACPGVTFGKAYDGLALEVVLQVPSNVRAIAYDSAFFTADWPNGLCSAFNDQVAVLMEPAPKGSSAGNIELADDGSPMTVNSAPLEACRCDTPPCEHSGKDFACSLGASLLNGTGFETVDAGEGSHAATGWLTTWAPVESGAVVTLRWLIYDSSDGLTDSTLLLDNFRFIAAQPASPNISEVRTEPSPPP